MMLSKWILFNQDRGGWGGGGGGIDIVCPKWMAIKMKKFNIKGMLLLLFINSPSVGTPLEELNTRGFKAKLM